MELQDSHEWVLWQARVALNDFPKPHVVPKVVVQEVKKRKRKIKHWSGSFQDRFCAWLVGTSERPCDLGYTRRELQRHLQRQFARGMKWENYAGGTPGNRHDSVWVVDHIVPKRLFDAEDVQHAYALTNLRPLWMLDNIKKAGIRQHLL